MTATLAVLQITASDYLICIFYWILHWPSFKFQLLITSFVSFIGHYIGRPSNSSFWLPHLYLLLDITSAVLQIPASDYLFSIFYWTLHWLSFKFQLLITSFVSFIGHYIGRPWNCSFWLPHLYLLLDITLAILQIPASAYLVCIFYWTLHWPSFTFQLLITSLVSFIGHYNITLAVLQIRASDYLICIIYWTLHWPSFTFQLLITSFVSFIGHYICRPSHFSFWLPYLYLLLLKDTNEVIRSYNLNDDQCNVQ
jgi:uncharacterized membrane protein